MVRGTIIPSQNTLSLDYSWLGSPLVTNPVAPDSTTVTGNRHSVNPAIWRPPQRGRGIRRKVPDGTVTVAVQATPPTPEITVSKTIEKIILAPTGEAESKALLDFARNKAERQHAQPALAETKQHPSLLAPPRLAHEEFASVHQRRAREKAEHDARMKDDAEIEQIMALMEDD